MLNKSRTGAALHVPAIYHSPAINYKKSQQQQYFPHSIESVSLLQRVVEILVAITALIILLPAALVVGLIIKLGSPGPALFIQERLSKGCGTFYFAKFRTLYADAKERFPELYAYQYNPDEIKDMKFKIKNDPRVTPQGRWLRKTTLDEIPNFLSLLKGDITIVGPRPEIPEMLPYYSTDMLKKFTVRPGITGLAQVSGRGNLGFLETVNLDIEYVKNKSLVLDIKIILLTIKKIVVRDGAF